MGAVVTSVPTLLFHPAPPPDHPIRMMLWVAGVVGTSGVPVSVGPRSLDCRHQPSTQLLPSLGCNAHACSI